MQKIEVTFTDSATILGNSSVSPSSYLKLQVLVSKLRIMSLKIWYKEGGMPPLYEEILDERVFISIVDSMKGDGRSLFSKTMKFIKSLPEEEVLTISREITKLDPEGNIFESLVCGLASYIAFFVLNENGNFNNRMPFQFSMPYRLDSGLLVNYNAFQYTCFALTPLSKIVTGILLQFTLFIQSFINTWGGLFVEGPPITTTPQTVVEIISGISHYVSSSLLQAHVAINDKSENLSANLLKEVRDVELRLQSQLDEFLLKARRELGDLLSDMRRSSGGGSNFKSSWDENSLYTERREPLSYMGYSPETYSLQHLALNSRSTENLHSDEISEEIRQLRHFTETSLDSHSNKFQEMVNGLEHRVEILYDNFILQSKTKDEEHERPQRQSQN